MKALLFILVIVAWSNLYAAQPSVKVMALFSNKAMLQIDGENHVLKKGQRLKGITLKSANGRKAVVRFDNGLEKTLGLNQSIQQAYKKPQNKTLTLYANNSGMFTINGYINGQSTQFVVDTGATFVSISQAKADRLNLEYETGDKIYLQAANEVIPGWRVNLDSVKVGEIRVPQVPAVVTTGSTPHVLLGMAFLKHLKMERNGAAMILEQKFKQ